MAFFVSFSVFLLKFYLVLIFNLFQRICFYENFSKIKRSASDALRLFYVSIRLALVLAVLYNLPFVAVF